MNFLALVKDIKDIFATETPTAKHGGTLSQYKAPQPRRDVAPVRPNAAPKPSPSYSTDERAFGQLPRRIRRLKALALEGGYSNGAQIEGLKVSGLWAQSFVKLYDSSNPGQKHILESRPIAQVFVFVNNCIDKGQI